MSKRALLILIGGRQVPNLLTVQHWKPNFIVPIASHEALMPNKEWSRIKPVLQQLCPDGLADPGTTEAFRVDAFDLEQVRKACNAAMARHSDAEWLFNITCATSIMSIGAYEVGIQRGASIWYLDTATQRVAALGGSPPENNLYKMKVEDYMAVYGRRVEVADQLPNQQEIQFAKKLAEQPAEAMKFRKALKDAKADQGRQDQPRVAIIESTSAAMNGFCLTAQDCGMISQQSVSSGSNIRCELPDARLWKFMEGKWLEIYTWAMADEGKWFDDYHYDLSIPTDNPNESSSQEFDLALTYAASLLIAECKCEKKPFETEHLTKLRAIANMIGGNFVGCVFIAAQLSSEFPGAQNKHGTYEHFCSQARAHQVVVVPGEELINLGTILRREAGADSQQRPTFSRG